MHDVVRFWLDRGVDGLRLDAIIKIAKDPQLRDTAGARGRATRTGRRSTIGWPGCATFLEEYPDRMMVGELWAEGPPRFVTFITGNGMHLAHNFEFVDLPWDAALYRDFIDRFEAETAGSPARGPAGSWRTTTCPGSASRFDDAGLGRARARAVLLLVNALRGTPFLYQGQELGLPNADIPADRVVDVDGRDPQRAPIPWQRPSVAGPGAGFTTGEPWLPLIEDAEDLCVGGPGGRSLVRRCTWPGASPRSGRARPTLQSGAQRTLDAGPDILAWLREDDAAPRTSSRSTSPRGRRPRGAAARTPAPPGCSSCPPTPVATGRSRGTPTPGQPSTWRTSSAPRGGRAHPAAAHHPDADRTARRGARHERCPAGRSPITTGRRRTCRTWRPTSGTPSRCSCGCPGPAGCARRCCGSTSTASRP